MFSLRGPFIFSLLASIYLHIGILSVAYGAPNSDKSPERSGGKSNAKVPDKLAGNTEISESSTGYKRLHHKCGNDEDCGHGSFTQLLNEKDNGNTAQRVAEAIHMAIDGEHQHFHSFNDFIRAYSKLETWKKFKDEFDFKALSLRTVRVYNLYKNDPELKDHAKNLVFIVPFSHLVETSLAPVFMATGTYLEWSQPIILTGGAILSVAIIPGLDPLCLLILATYPLKPVYKSVNFVRQQTESLAKWIYRNSGTQGFVNRNRFQIDSFDLYSEVQKWMENEASKGVTQVDNFPENELALVSNKRDGFEDGPYQENLVKNSIQVVFTEDLHFKRVRLVHSGQTLMELIFKIRPFVYKPNIDPQHMSPTQVITSNMTTTALDSSIQDVHLATIKIHKNLNGQMELQKKVLKGFDSLFSWNLRNAIKESLDSYNHQSTTKYEKQFFMESMIEEENYITFNFVEGAIPWRVTSYWFDKKKSFLKARKQFNRCLEALNN
jgi:hypothetical protein